FALSARPSMENSHIILLFVSSAVSFGIGRAFMHSRGKKRRREAALAAARQAQLLRERPPEPPSSNKAKRKRQLQQQSRNADGR
ncbi:MAG: hypothetical protein LH479_07570, partial [Polaromonas sp.]|nr:hypothetical protein [Polaromonas sp.]